MFKICEICKKVPATVHLTEINNNVKTEIHMCESCAAAKGVDIKKPLSLQQLFAGKLAVSSGEKAEKPRASASNVICPHCGISWEDFQEKGRLGCALDYEVFAQELRPLLDDFHATPGRHIGKRPHPTPLDEHRRRKLECQRLLQEAVAREDYREAARLRDCIRELER